MIDYKKYKKVLEILNGDIKRDLTQGSSLGDFSELTNEDKATAICELFDEKPALKLLFKKTFIISYRTIFGYKTIVCCPHCGKNIEIDVEELQKKLTK